MENNKRYKEHYSKVDAAYKDFCKEHPGYKGDIEAHFIMGEVKITIPS